MLDDIWFKSLKLVYRVESDVTAASDVLLDGLLGIGRAVGVSLAMKFVLNLLRLFIANTRSDG